jgi:hypothetical protein
LLIKNNKGKTALCNYVQKTDRTFSNRSFNLQFLCIELQDQSRDLHSFVKKFFRCSDTCSNNFCPNVFFGARVVKVALHISGVENAKLDGTIFEQLIFVRTNVADPLSLAAHVELSFTIATLVSLTNH